MKYNLQLFSLDYSVLINSDVDINSLFESSLRFNAFIPNFSTTTVSGKEKVISKIIYKQSSKKGISYNRNNNTYLIKDDWSAGLPIYIIYLFFKIFNDGYTSHKNPLIVFHASAVTKGKKDITIVSYTGGGKTSIMLELISKYNFKMLSNNKTVFRCDKSGCGIIAGTTTISIRDSLFDKLKIKIVKREPFIQRKIILPDKNYLAEFNKDNKEKSNIIIIPQVNEGFRNVVEIDKKEALFYLFPMALELINREVILFNGEKICPNNEISTNKKQAILGVLKNLIKDSSVFQISGSVDYICEKINEKI